MSIQGLAFLRSVKLPTWLETFAVEVVWIAGTVHGVIYACIRQHGDVL